jgi:hypothetical protein
MADVYANVTDSYRNMTCILECDGYIQEYDRCIRECDGCRDEYCSCILELDICIKECDTRKECDGLIQELCE